MIYASDRFSTMVAWTLTIVGMAAVVIGALMASDRTAGDVGIAGIAFGLVLLGIVSILRLLRAMLDELARQRVHLERIASNQTTRDR